MGNLVVRMIQDELTMERSCFLYSGDATAIRVKPYFLRNTRMESSRTCRFSRLLSGLPVMQQPVIASGGYPAVQ